MRKKAVNLLFLLSEKSLEIVDIPGNKHIHIPFTDLHIKNQEVGDKERLYFHVRDRLESENIEQRRGVLFLADDLICTHTYSPNEGATEADMREQFGREIPFETEKTVQHEIRTPESLRLFAANRELYSVVVHASEKASVPIVSVVPWRALGLSTEHSLTLDQANAAMAIYQENSELQTFFPIDGMKYKTGVSGGVSGIRKPFTIIIVVLLCIFALLLIARRMMQSHIPSQEISPLPTTGPISPTEIPSATLREVDSLTVLVKNGTGIAGQAKTVSAQLNSLGFKSIETANSEASNSSDATVTFGVGVPPNIQQKVNDIMQSLFINVVTSAARSSPEADIVIVTGKQR